jgi:tetratricopeptide (TPR) repeat protein
MQPVLLALALCAVTAFSLAAWLEPWFQSWAGNRVQSGNLLQVALGDSRRLFAKHFYAKADAYFHSGYYPSIFDRAPRFGPSAITGRDPDLGHPPGDDHNDDHHHAGGHCVPWLGQPKDWIDRFSRSFYPGRETHLGDRGGGEERELLPWLRLSANLDPEQPETYLTASFWLRTKLGKVDEAEQFLREGLRANPGNYEILFELGRIYNENRHDPARARNMWELALRAWQQKNAGQPEPDRLALALILGQLATVEGEAKDYFKALEHLEALQAISPFKKQLQEWIDWVKKQQASSQPPSHP